MSVAKVFTDWNGIDVLASAPTVEVKGRNLRAGMVLVDDLDTPVAGLDHRVKGLRNSGCVAFLVHDLVHGGWHRHDFHANKPFKVVAR